jgi:hypothetical protein
MSRGHTFDHLLGQRMVSSLDIPERRKSAAEIQRMPIEDQLIYYRLHPEEELSDSERTDALRRELSDDDYRRHGEIDPQWILDNEPPPGWDD